MSVLPDIYVQNISPSTFVGYFDKLGNVYQPSATQTAIAQSLVASYAANTTIMASSSQESLAFSTLSTLAIFYPFSTYASNISTVLNFNFNLLFINSNSIHELNQVVNKWRLSVVIITDSIQYISDS